MQFPALQPPSWCQYEPFCKICLSSFSPHIFESFFVILVIKINKVNSCQSSSIVVFCLFLSILSNFINSSSHFWSYMIWSGGRLNFCQSLLGPHVSFERFSFNRINLVKPFHESDKLLFESKFQVFIDTFLLQNVQMNTSNLVPSIYLLNRECFFLRH